MAYTIPADKQAAINAFAAKWGASPQAIAAVLATETGGKLDPAMQGYGGAPYSGIFMLSHDYVGQYTQQAFGKALTPEEYRQLSFNDQLKVMDAFYVGAGVKPGDFKNDPAYDVRLGWVLQLSPGLWQSKQITADDILNNTAVISRTNQADILMAVKGTKENPGTVTTASAEKSLALVKDYPSDTTTGEPAPAPTTTVATTAAATVAAATPTETIQPGAQPLTTVQTLNLLSKLGADKQQELIDLYNSTNYVIGAVPVADINVRPFLEKMRDTINSATAAGEKAKVEKNTEESNNLWDYRTKIYETVGITYTDVLGASNTVTNDGQIIGPLNAYKTLTASNIESGANAGIDPNAPKVVAVGVTQPDGSVAAKFTAGITKLDGGTLQVVSNIEGGQVKYIVGNNGEEATRTVLIYDNTGKLLGAGTDMADATAKAASNGASTNLLTAANQDYSDKGQFAIANMDRAAGNTADPAVSSPSTTATPDAITAALRADATAVIESSKTQVQPPRSNADNASANSNASTAGRGDTPATSAESPRPGQKKILVETAIIPNPVHRLASYTYNWTLWWLSIRDYNEMQKGGDVGVGVAKTLGPDSYVIAEDSGLYVDRRHPATLGLNYNIQDVEFDTVIGMNKLTKSSSMITGSMTILEPYGVSFLNSLIQAATDPKTGLPGNYVSQPYMLELNFVGYDDQGNPIPGDQVGLTRKRFPIRMLAMKISVNGKGSEYKISFCPTGSTPHHLKDSYVPQNWSITAKTVDEFFNGPEGLAAKLNRYWLTETAGSKRASSDFIKFEIDDTIKKSAIVDPKQTTLKKSNPDSQGKTVDVSANTFTFPHSMSIIDIIHKIMPNSQFFIDQLGLQKPNTAATQEQIYSHFKVTTRVEYGGLTASGAVVEGAFDNTNNRRNMIMTYGIHQYAILDPTHPKLPQGTNSSAYLIKDYQYIYTGQNIDVLDFKLQFDTTYYTALQSYTNRVPSYRTTQNTAVSKFLDKLPSPVLGIGALSNLVKEFAAVPQVNPQVFKPIVNDKELTSGGNQTDRAEVVQAADVGKSLLSSPSGDMMSIDLTIVGDPTLVKQDDWLYVPDPKGSPNWNAQVSQADFVKKYGHIRMAQGQVVINVTVNTPLDLDTDYNNTGLAFPPPNTTPAVFSGIYKILTIKNTFKQGVFTQVLKAVRVNNADLVGTFSSAQNKQRTTDTGSNSVGLNQTNQTNAAGDTNGAPALGDNTATAIPVPAPRTITGTPL